jgi:hypothetical protein
LLKLSEALPNELNTAIGAIGQFVQNGAVKDEKQMHDRSTAASLSKRLMILKAQIPPQHDQASGIKTLDG